MSNQHPRDPETGKFTEKRRVHPKAIGASLGAAASTIVLWLLETFTGVGDVPTAVEGAATTIIVFLVTLGVGHWTRDV